jgi:hypothetical protein
MIGADLRGAGNTSTPAQTIYAWGAQVEVLPYMSSHIPTTSVSVTRARDVLYYPIPSAVSGYNPTTYSLFVEFDSAITTSSRGGISDGVFGNSTYFVNNGFVSAQTGGGSANGAVMTAGPINKQCGTYSATQLKCCNNGAIVGSVAATVAGQPTATRLSVGCSPWALDNQLNGHMRRVSYWPRVLSDSEMQAVTTLAGPTLSLDFMQPGTLDPRITFTRASSATYTDASGVIQTAVTNAPRWDYAGGVLRGVLIEEARTNLILQSQDVNQAVWTKSGTITVTGTVAAPDGTTTAQTFSIAASGVSATYQIVTVASATRAEPSFWIKPVTTTGIFSVENPANNANGNWSVNVALLNPAIWQRVTRNHPAVTISAEFTGTAGNQCGVFIRTGGPVINASWWGFSCEIGAFPTSYIPTTSVSVTRAADVATMPVNATTWYAPYPTPNTLAFEAFQVQNNSKAAVMTGLINASSQRTGNNVSGGNTLTMFDNVAGMNFSVQAVPVGSPYKMAFRFGPGAQGACVNGGAITTQANAALTSGMTTLLLGCDGFGSQANAYLRRVNYWNRALSDTEMQQVTT